MSRPTHVFVDTDALQHNLARVKTFVPHSKIQAVIKARAYGCAFAKVVPALEEAGVWAFGVACMEEALAVRALGVKRDCILMQGLFSQEELPVALHENFQIVLHHRLQLEWLLRGFPNKNPSKKIKVWIKVNTGMNRLGFLPHEIYDIAKVLADCPWVLKPIGLFTHLASADEPEKPITEQQVSAFNALSLPTGVPFIKSIASSAAIIGLPQTHTEVVRPGIMLFGASPFAGKVGADHGLKPVMHFSSAISTIHHYPAGTAIGYSGTWTTPRDSVIAIVPVGYGDGYPRHIKANTPVWINGELAPIVGRVSMDMVTVDVTHCKKNVRVGDAVELWGTNIPIETIAESAGTLPHELLCQFNPRAPETP